MPPRDNRITRRISGGSAVRFIRWFADAPPGFSGCQLSDEGGNPAFTREIRGSKKILERGLPSVRHKVIMGA